MLTKDESEMLRWHIEIEEKARAEQREKDAAYVRWCIEAINDGRMGRSLRSLEWIADELEKGTAAEIRSGKEEK